MNELFMLPNFLAIHCVTLRSSPIKQMMHYTFLGRPQWVYNTEWLWNLILADNFPFTDRFNTKPSVDYCLIDAEITARVNRRNYGNLPSPTISWNKNLSRAFPMKWRHFTDNIYKTCQFTIPSVLLLTQNTTGLKTHSQFHTAGY